MALSDNANQVFAFLKMNPWSWIRAITDLNIGIVPCNGTPTNGTTGFGAGYCAKGCLAIDNTTGTLYSNIGSQSSPFWVPQVVGTVPLVPITANGAIAVRPATNYVITKAGVAAMTLAAPTAGAPSAGGDDGTLITVYSSTAFAHTVTATGLLQTGTDAVNLVTFNPIAGASIGFMAFNGKWMIVDPIGVTLS